MEKYKKEDLTPEEEAQLKEESELLAKSIAEKAEAKKVAKLKKAEEEGEKTFTRAETLALIQKAVADAINGVAQVEDDADDPYAKKTVRLPRMMNKFIMGFKNMNEDEYFPDRVVEAFDQFNPITKQNVAHVTLIFEDDTELIVPLDTALTRSQKVDVELLEVITKDTSYSAGRTERAEVKDYTRSGTGQFVKMKVTQASYKYRLKLPNSDKEVIVGPSIINW